MIHLLSRAFALLVVLATLVAGASAEVALNKKHNRTPVKDRADVFRDRTRISLTNARANYVLSFDAHVGEPVRMGPDKQIEGIRAPYPASRNPTRDQLGFTSLGLGPAGNWDAMGFFNLFINDIGLTLCEPKIDTAATDDEGRVTLTWRNSQATVTQTFVLRDRDDKLLMRLHVEPHEDVSIRRLVLRLNNQPARANHAYGNPASRSTALVTASGVVQPTRRTTLDPGRQSWLAVLNRERGNEPSAIMYRPEEIDRAQALVGEDAVRPNLFLDAEQRTFHFALWQVPHFPNEHLVKYLMQRGDALNDDLDRLSGTDWQQPLPSLSDSGPADRLPPSVYQPSASERERGYIVAKAHPFDYVDANTLPTQRLSQLTLQAAKNQVAQAGFLVHGLKPTGVMRATPGALKSKAGHVISKAQLDLRVVKVWLQSARLRGSVNVHTPELLLRDATVAPARLGDMDESNAKRVVHGPTRTRVPRGTSRHFWLGVDVPADTPAGVYRGAIMLEPENGEAFSLPVQLRVQPFALDSPDEDYVLGIYYRNKPYPAGSESLQKSNAEYITLDRYRRELGDIREHGFNALSFYNRGGIERLDYFYPAYTDLGFREPVMMMRGAMSYNDTFDEKTNQKQRDNVRRYLRYAHERALPQPAFYGIDEPDPGEIEQTIKRAKITRDVSLNGARGRFMVAGNRRAMPELVGHIDYPIISSYFSSRDEMRELRDRYQKAGAHPLYYWQIWAEYPKGQRLNTGYFLYASGYEGVWPYVYQHLAGDAYEEINSRKDMCVAYPSAAGPVPTLQWKGALAGINDLRYLITLDRALADLESSAPEAAARLREQRDELLQKYGYEQSAHWGRIIYGALNWPVHQDAVANATFDADRERVAQMIRKAQRLQEQSR